MMERFRMRFSVIVFADSEICAQGFFTIEMLMLSAA